MPAERRVTERLSGAVRRSTWLGGPGRATVYACDRWPGVSVWLNEVRARALPADQGDGRCLKVNYCLAGRCELRLEQEGYFYQYEGLLSVSSGRTRELYSYPTGLYDGLEVLLLPDEMPPGVRETAESLGFSCEGRGRTLFGAPSEEARGLMGRLAGLLRNGQAPVERYRALTLGLLHLVGAGGLSPAERGCYLTPGQREIARLAEADLTRDLGARVTVEQLAERYKVSPSSLKKYFAVTYGASVTSYMQRRRCEKAAALLAGTSLKVGEVARMVLV